MSQHELLERIEHWAEYLEQAPARAEEEGRKFDDCYYSAQAGLLRAVCEGTAAQMREVLKRASAPLVAQ